MALNVRNPDTLGSLRRLAEITGEPMTIALDRAVKERLTRLRTQANDRLSRLRQISADTSARWPDDQRVGDLTSSLYDDLGQPV